jgi:hypothetical protein
MTTTELAAELQRHLDLTSRDLNHARCILECRDPAIVDAIAHDTGQSTAEVQTVLDSARRIHTAWPSLAHLAPVAR